MKGIRWRCRACLAVAAVGVVLAGAVPAEASRKASTRDARAMTRAIQTTSLAGLDEVPRNRYRVTGARVSSLTRSWAIARIVAQRGFRDSFQDSYAILVRTAGRTWVVVDVGTSQVGCGIAANAVLADLLGAGGAPCPSGEGYG